MSTPCIPTKVASRQYSRLALACCVVAANLAFSLRLFGQEPGLKDASSTPSKEAASSPESAPAAESAPENIPSEPLKFAEGALVMSVPQAWRVVEPKINIIEREFQLPSPEHFKASQKEEKADDSDPQAGRVTCMLAGGGIQANIDRWVKQFKSDKEAEIVHKELKVAGLSAHWIEYSGTFVDRRGPFAPAVEKPDHKLIGLIVELEGQDDYFIKVTAPNTTADFWAKTIQRMIDTAEKPASDKAVK